MTNLTEQAAEEFIAARAFAPAPPSFVGAAVEVLLDRPAAPGRAPLRHGFREAVSSRVVVVSGPPSPGLEACLTRMAEDLSLAGPAVSAPSPVLNPGAALYPSAASGTSATLNSSATSGTTATSSSGAALNLGTAPGIGTAPNSGAASGISATVDPSATPNPEATLHPSAAGGLETAGILVGLEAGLDGGGPLGVNRRWALANILSPVLAAAFANSPAAGWRSVHHANLQSTPLPAGDARTAWTAYAMAPLRDRFRRGDRISRDELIRHLNKLNPPVAARGHLEWQVADHQAGDGWRLPIAVAATLLDDPHAALDAEAATAHLHNEPRLRERAARDALTDPALSVAARDCFLAAYAALARQGVSRALRDALADYIDRYVMRGRCPADDILDRTAAHP